MAKKEEQRNSFTFYASFEEAINEIEESDYITRYELYRAIARYSLYREQPKLKGISKIVWRVILPLLDNQWVKYNNGCKGKDFGVLGGAPKGNKNASKTTPKQPQNNPQDKDIDKDIDKDKGKEQQSIVVGNNAPSANDVDDWCYALTQFYFRDMPSYIQEKVSPLFTRWWNAKQANMIAALKDVEKEMNTKIKNELDSLSAMASFQEDEDDGGDYYREIQKILI